VQVSVRSTLAHGLDSLRQWMQHYPYSCLEQQVSRAIVLRDEGLWRHIVSTLPAHLDSDGLLKYFPTMPQGSEVLTAYLLSIAHEAGWTMPSELQEPMLQGLQKFVGGHLLRRTPVAAVDLSLRKLSALETLSRYTKPPSQLLSSIAIEPNLWPTSALLDWWSVLQRLRNIPNRTARLQDVERLIRSRLNVQGTSVGFSTESSDSLWWLMSSPDTNAVRLILLALPSGQWQVDLPRLMRGTLSRQRRGVWDLTVANAWGTLAVEKFSQAFEKTPVGGVTTASLANVVQRLEWVDSPQGRALTFPWPFNGAVLNVDHSGSGHPWVTIESQAAIPLKAPLSSGYRVTKTLTPVEPSVAGHFSRGDVVRVRLTVEAERDMTWVVIDDPVPAGASHLGTGLGRDSQVATQGEKHSDRIWPTFSERAFDTFRAYYEYIPKGSFVVEYTIRLNQSGAFHLPPTRVEALYAPEVFAELPNAVVEVQP
jgi:alpha-2-macroglobulin